MGVALTVQIASVPTADVSIGAYAPAVEASESGTTLALGVMLEEPRTRAEVEVYVRDYFDDIPILADVARCESHFRHIDEKTGDILRGVVNSRDVGVMQINTYYHEATARRMGLDLFTLEGNLAYARNLYEREGTRPWNASRACWQSDHIAMR